MNDDDLRPGEWPDLADQELYRRLRRLAERRLWGNSTHHADDVVSRAIIRWARMDPGTSSAARLEKVIASEVSSLMRSEARLKRRERRSTLDRSGPLGAEHPGPSLLGPSLAEVISRRRWSVTAADGAILELLYEGHTISDIADTLGLSRFAVLGCRERWRRIVRATAAVPAPLGTAAARPAARPAGRDDPTDQRGRPA